MLVWCLTWRVIKYSKSPAAFWNSTNKQWEENKGTVSCLGRAMKSYVSYDFTLSHVMQMRVNWGYQKYVAKLSKLSHISHKIHCNFSTERQIKVKLLPSYPRRSKQQSQELNAPLFCVHIFSEKWCENSGRCISHCCYFCTLKC